MNKFIEIVGFTRTEDNVDQRTGGVIEFTLKTLTTHYQCKFGNSMVDGPEPRSFIRKTDGKELKLGELIDELFGRPLTEEESDNLFEALTEDGSDEIEEILNAFGGYKVPKPIEVLSYINSPEEADLGDIHSHAEDARKGQHLRIINVGDEEVSVVYNGPADATDAEIIAADEGLQDL